MPEEENNEEGSTPIPEKEKEMMDQAKEILDHAKDKVVDTIKNAMNHFSPVKARTTTRLKQLVKASKWKKEKQIIHGQVDWQQTPPRELIGSITASITGGIGKIRYVRYLKDSETGQALKECSPDGLEIGGPIISHYVQELIEPAQKIKREAVVVKGCPSELEAKKRLTAAREYERNRIKKTRGIE